MAHRIGMLVVGKNDGWKQAIELGKRTNQNFVFVPHARFVAMLRYKAELVGIQVVVREESYTSKCSFLDLEPIGKHKLYAGKRVKRGLFRASTGRCLNADINAAFNILRKVVPDAFGNGIGGVVVHPVRIALANGPHGSNVHVALELYPLLVTGPGSRRGGGVGRSFGGAGAWRLLRAHRRLRGAHGRGSADAL